LHLAAYATDALLWLCNIRHGCNQGMSIFLRCASEQWLDTIEVFPNLPTSMCSLKELGAPGYTGLVWIRTAQVNHVYSHTGSLKAYSFSSSACDAMYFLCRERICNAPTSTDRQIPRHYAP